MSQTGSIYDISIALPKRPHFHFYLLGVLYLIGITVDTSNLDHCASQKSDVQGDGFLCLLFFSYIWIEQSRGGVRGYNSKDQLSQKQNDLTYFPEQRLSLKQTRKQATPLIQSTTYFVLHLFFLFLFMFLHLTSTNTRCKFF